MSYSPDQARAHTLGARFLPADPGDSTTRPCITLPDDRQCYFYYDDDGTLHVKVHLDGGPDEDVSLQITVGESIIYQDIVDLPVWDQMSDRDKGAALLHAAKRENEGASYAVEHYACRYFDDPRLTRLTPETASRHAARTVGDTYEIVELIGQAEYERLYDAALDAEQEQRSR